MIAAREVADGLRTYGAESASGDNYTPAIRTLVEGGLQLYHDLTKEPLTGFERKGRSTDRNTQRQPFRAYFERGTESEFMVVGPPQDFREHISSGKVKVVAGAGYDIEVDRAGMDDLSLNGKMNDPTEREEVMQMELKRAGYSGICLGIKPVMFPLIVPRSSGIRTLQELRARSKRKPIRAVSEFPHILGQYLKQKGVDAEVYGAYSGADGQVIAGLYDLGMDLVESGGTVLEHVHDIRLLTDDETERIAVATYSSPWVLAPHRSMRGRFGSFFKALCAFIEENREALRKAEPDLFAEKYADLLERVREREREMGLE